MSSLSRPSIHKRTAGASPPASPRPRSRKRSPREEVSDDELDSSANSDLLNDSMDENNSARGRKPRKGKRNPYPNIDDLVDDAEVEDEGRKNRRGRKKEDITSQRRGKDNKRSTTYDRKTHATDQKNGDQNSGTNTFMKMLVVIVLGALGAWFYLHGTTENVTVDVTPTADHFKLFMEEYNHLKSQFPEQSERFWKIIGSQIKRVLTQESPTYPAIVLVGIPSQQSHMGACLTKRIVHRLNSIQKLSGDFFIDTTELDASTPSKMKLHLDQRMQKALNSSSTVVLDHIEKLHGEAALLLHAYCDGDNAPYKKAVIFLVLHSSVKFPEVETQHDEVVENILENLWLSSLGKDEMPALQSRIANNIVVMKPESSNICK